MSVLSQKSLATIGFTAVAAGILLVGLPHLSVADTLTPTATQNALLPVPDNAPAAVAGTAAGTASAAVAARDAVSPDPMPETAPIAVAVPSTDASTAPGDVAAVPPADDSTTTAAVPPADAAPLTPLTIELNAMNQLDSVCRLSLRFRNNLPVNVDDMALEVVLLDGDGATMRFVLLRTEEIPAGRMRIRQYDMPALSCDEVGSVLLNDIRECSGNGLTPQYCLDRVSVRSLAAAAFQY